MADAVDASNNIVRIVPNEEKNGQFMGATIVSTGDHFMVRTLIQFFCSHCCIYSSVNFNPSISHIVEFFLLPYFPCYSISACIASCLNYWSVFHDFKESCNNMHILFMDIVTQSEP